MRFKDKRQHKPKLEYLVTALEDKFGNITVAVSANGKVLHQENVQKSKIKWVSEKLKRKLLHEFI